MALLSRLVPFSLLVFLIGGTIPAVALQESRVGASAPEAMTVANSASAQIRRGKIKTRKTRGQKVSIGGNASKETRRKVARINKGKNVKNLRVRKGEKIVIN